MIICLTGLSCTGKTTVSKLFSEKYNYYILSVRDISHSLAIKNGYSRTREWLNNVSVNEYLSECRNKIIGMVNSDKTKNYIIDDLFDIQLWNAIHIYFDSVLISFTTLDETRYFRINQRENKANSKDELEFLDKWKMRFGIQDVINCSIKNISTNNITSNEICEEIYGIANSYSLNNIFINDIKTYKTTIDNFFAQEDNLLNKIDIPQFMRKYVHNFCEYSIGGKRIRAYLVKLGFELTNKKIIPEIIEASISYEIFQTGILIHDDIIDESDTRRNLPAMHIKLGGNHVALSKAICIGDLGIIQSLSIISSLPFNNSLVQKALLHQTKVFELTVFGELKDIELSDCSQYSLDDIIEMYNLKTSWYTVIGPLQLGAILGNADDQLLNKIEEFGSLLGIAFQIKDDILGIFGQANIIGKSNLSDMQEGKKTVLTEYFSKHANSTMIEKFDSIYGKNESSEEELVIIRKLLKDSGALEFSTKLYEEYLWKAKKIILSLKLNPYTQQILLGLINYLGNRAY